MTAADDEKDRLGDILHNRQKADEDRFFAQREAEALARLRQRAGAAPDEAVCPRCGEHLTANQCPAGHR